MEIWLYQIRLLTYTTIHNMCTFANVASVSSCANGWSLGLLAKWQGVDVPSYLGYLLGARGMWHLPWRPSWKDTRFSKERCDHNLSCTLHTPEGSEFQSAEAHVGWWPKLSFSGFQKPYISHQLSSTQTHGTPSQEVFHRMLTHASWEHVLDEGNSFMSRASSPRLVVAPKITVLRMVLRLSFK